MSVRASGNPGSARRATRVALVLGLLTALAGPLAPLTAAAGGVTVTTPFPAIVAEPGSTASFKLAIDVSSARQVSLKAEDVPSGWTARFRGGGLVIDGAYVTPGDTPDVTLDVEIPDGAAAGSTNLRVVATGGGGVDTLPLTIRVADAAAGDVTLTSDFPELQAASGSTFTFNVTLHNDTAADTTFTMQATGPDGWTVGAKPQSQAQATTLTVNAGATGDITVTADPSVDAGAGSYPITLTTSGGGKDATLDLAATITGTYTLTLSTPDQVLSTTANAGSREGVRPEPRQHRVRAGHGRRVQLEHADRLEGRVHARRRRHGRPRHAGPGNRDDHAQRGRDRGRLRADDDRQGRRGVRRRDDPRPRRDPAAVVDRRGRAHRPRVRGPVLGLPDVRAAVGR